MIEFLPRAGLAAGLEFPTRRALVPPDRTRATGVPALASLRAEPIQDRQVRRPGPWSASRIARFSVLMDFAVGAIRERDRARRTPESDAAWQREGRNSSRPIRPGPTPAVRADGRPPQEAASDRQRTGNSDDGRACFGESGRRAAASRSARAQSVESPSPPRPGGAGRRAKGSAAESSTRQGCGARWWASQRTPHSEQTRPGPKRCPEAPGRSSGSGAGAETAAPLGLPVGRLPPPPPLVPRPWSTIRPASRARPEARPAI